MLKHLLRSGMSFLLYIFNFYWFLHSFPSIWKASSIVSIHKMGKPLDSPASFLPISPPASQSFLNALFYLAYFSFWSLAPFSLPARLISALDGLLSIKFCTFLSPYRMGLTNPSRALGRSLLLLISRKLLLCLVFRPFPQTHFGWPLSLLCSLDSIFPL